MFSIKSTLKEEIKVNEELINNFKLTNLTYQCLRSKIKDEEISDFLDYNFSFDMINNPIINQASKDLEDIIFNTNKKILVITDYDADGISSAVVCYKLLSLVLAKDRFKVITNKRRYGNGVNEKTLEEIKDLESYDVLITADHGSSNNDIFIKMKEKNKNLKIFLTDHHTVYEDNYPNDVDYFINNQLILKDEVSWKEMKNFSGCCVVFTLLYFTLRNRVSKSRILYLCLPFLAITIISDVMGVDDKITRSIVRDGLRVMNDSRYELFDVMKNYLRLEPLYTTETIKYLLSPLINTGNRQHQEELIFNLLTTTDHEDILTSLTKVNMLNNDRKKFTNMIVDLIIKSDKLKGEYGKSIVVKTDMGINGIIASKIGEIYQKPCICFLNIDGHFHGSARSIVKDFNILEILDKLNEEKLVLKYGGHKEACGCVIEEDKIDLFRERFDILSKEELSKIENNNTIEVLKEIKPNEITFDNIINLSLLDPLGKNFENPLFYSELTVESCFSSKSMSFLKFKELNPNIKGVSFKNGRFNHDEVYVKGNKIGMVFTMRLSYFKNNYEVSLSIIDAIVKES